MIIIIIFKNTRKCRLRRWPNWLSVTSQHLPDLLHGQVCPSQEHSQGPGDLEHSGALSYSPFLVIVLLRGILN